MSERMLRQGVEFGSLPCCTHHKVWCPTQKSLLPVFRSPRACVHDSKCWQRRQKTLFWLKRKGDTHVRLMNWYLFFASLATLLGSSWQVDVVLNTRLPTLQIQLRTLKGTEFVRFTCGFSFGQNLCAVSREPRLFQVPDYDGSLLVVLLRKAAFLLFQLRVFTYVNTEIVQVFFSEAVSKLRKSLLTDV